MKVEFAGGAYQTFSKPLNAQECVNFFTHIDQEGGTSQLSLRGTPGLKVWKDTGEYAEVRGAKRQGSYVYSIVGNKVFRIDKNKTLTECTGTLGTSSGSVSIAMSPTQGMIVDGLNGYSISGTTITKITDDGFFNNPKTVTYQDGYFLVSFDGSANVQYSDDATSWDSTYYFNANAYPDNVVSVLSDHRDVLVLKESTSETWYDDGSSPFARKPGYSQEVGIGSRYSPVQLENTVYLLTDKIQMAKLQGSQYIPVSPRSIDYQMKQDSDISNAVGMGVEIEGNAFYILTTSNNTWVYNAATKFCHKLSSYPEPFTGRWRGNCAEYFDNKWIIGDYQNGILYELDFETFTDNSQPIVRKRVPQTLRQEGKMIFPSCLEIFFEQGTGLATGQGSDPKAMLRYSIDGGKTWSSEIWRDVGKIGEYKDRSVWNRFAGGRYFTPELTVSDPIKWVVMDANLEAEIGAT